MAGSSCLSLARQYLKPSFYDVVALVGFFEPVVRIDDEPVCIPPGQGRGKMVIACRLRVRGLQAWVKIARGMVTRNKLTIDTEIDIICLGRNDVASQIIYSIREHDTGADPDRLGRVCDTLGREIVIAGWRMSLTPGHTAYADHT